MVKAVLSAVMLAGLKYTAIISIASMLISLVAGWLITALRLSRNHGCGSKHRHERHLLEHERNSLEFSTSPSRCRRD